MVRADSEPRRMGLASAKSAASWRTEDGASGGAEPGIFLSYGYYSRKKTPKIRLFKKVEFCWCAPSQVRALGKLNQSEYDARRARHRIREPSITTTMQSASP